MKENSLFNVFFIKKMFLDHTAQLMGYFSDQGLNLGYGSESLES